MGEVYRARDSQAESRRRDQGAARAPGARIRRRSRGSSARRRRSRRCRIRTSSRSHDFGTDQRRRRLRRHRAARGRDAACAAGRRRAARPQGRRLRRPDRPRHRRGARARHRPSRPQAGEHLHHQGRRGEDPRLRPRQGRRRPPGADERSARRRRSRTRRPAPCSARSATCRRSRCAARRSITARTSSRSARCFYEMLTGQRPFRGDSHVETMNAILKEDPPEFSGINANAARRARAHHPPLPREAAGRSFPLRARSRRSRSRRCRARRVRARRRWRALPRCASRAPPRAEAQSARGRGGRRRRRRRCLLRRPRHLDAGTADRARRCSRLTYRRGPIWCRRA